MSQLVRDQPNRQRRLVQDRRSGQFGSFVPLTLDCAGDHQRGRRQLWSRLGVPVAARLRHIVRSRFNRLESVGHVVSIFGDLPDRAAGTPSYVSSYLLALLRRVSFCDARAVPAANDLAVKIHIAVIEEPAFADAMPSS